MFSHPRPAPPPPPALSTSSSAASPSSPTRPGRLRGLSYLMLSYTQNHIHPHTDTTHSASPQSRISPTRRHSTNTNSSLATSSRSPTAGAATLSTPQEHTSSTAHRPIIDPESPPHAHAGSATTSGWLPTVGGRSGLAGIATQPVPSSTPSPSAELAGHSATASTNKASLFTSLGRARAESAPMVARQTQSRIMAPPGPASGNGGHMDQNVAAPAPAPNTEQASNMDHHSRNGISQAQLPSIRFVPHIDPRSTRPSLVFSPISRTLPTPDSVIRVGRYSERDNNPNPPPNTPSAAPVGYKSKVVSRRHCEFWCSNGQWFIKDVRSSSGTFLNHIRLSSPGIESRPWPVNDGDVVQLGIDFRGGEEMIFRCVKIRVECNRGWQKGLNNFNVNTHKRLRNLGKIASSSTNDGDTASTHTSECSICLMSIAPCQSLFVAPCSHVWHYKCIRPILNTGPSFLCPNCRAMADLDAEVDDPNSFGEWEDEIHEAHGDEETGLHNEGKETIARALLGAASDTTELVVRNPDLSTNGNNNHRTSRPQSDGSGEVDHDEALAMLLGPVSIRFDNSNHDEEDDQHQYQRDSSNTSLHRVETHVETSETLQGNLSTALPSRPITRAISRASRMQEEDGQGAQNPESAQDALGSHRVVETSAEILSHEGPMTPRNDAGPFVFDGSAGRESDRRPSESAERGPDRRLTELLESTARNQG